VQRRIRTRAPGDADVPVIHHDSRIVASFLSDGAHVPGGFAAGVAFPSGESDTAALVAHASRILPAGAQSSLTGGATPRGDIVLSTRALTRIGQARDGLVRAGAGVPLSTLQKALEPVNAWYPPVPTFEGASVGGTIATNAAGPATFKYGSTRAWVAGLTVVLADGDVIDIERGQHTAPPGGRFDIERVAGGLTSVPVPYYEMPNVVKLSAGYYTAAPQTDLIDLFIGSEGTLGVIVEASLRLIDRPARAAVLLVCPDDTQAVGVTRALRDEARAAWAHRSPLDVAAIEYIDARAIALLPDQEFARAGLPRPPRGAVLLLVQIEVTRGDASAFERLAAVLAACGVDADPHVSMPGDERGAGRLFALREAVPAAVNGAVAAAKAVHPGIEKTAGDMIVPFDRVMESLAAYRDAFERRELDYAIWGHLSDGNLHPNVIPRSIQDVDRGREAILEIARRVIALGGAPLAEHGVGRSALKQQLLQELYGEDGIEQMRAVKRALDPGWKLAPGVLFPPSPLPAFALRGFGGTSPPS
jgi:D-lactate dehydrogenase (cytochrome)